jgi:hypothetical protein
LGGGGGWNVKKEERERKKGLIRRQKEGVSSKFGRKIICRLKYRPLRYSAIN